MGEREARALGAGKILTIGEQEYTLSPVTVRDLCELEREALRSYKRQFLETFRDSFDLLPEDEGLKLLREKLEEAARWTLDDLPKRKAFVRPYIRG